MGIWIPLAFCSYCSSRLLAGFPLKSSRPVGAPDRKGRLGLVNPSGEFKVCLRHAALSKFKIRLEKFCAGKPLWLTPRLTAIGENLRFSCANAVAYGGIPSCSAVSPDAQTFRKIKNPHRFGGLKQGHRFPRAARRRENIFYILHTISWGLVSFFFFLIAQRARRAYFE
ncbi:hypothetical protein DP113_34470 (plasmid) [Brasilonema octagenarum UFV-E1]|uniref:Uncharacterized protein n=2 Tax=Brasilonema TaxID=383614 RepID=A0A856MRK8_9CYAN|nr:hypothetical protein [Brasilonema octagenarum UFV-OR1]QDL12820.1 hypothetical protein DP114_34365 [Brasilonema sennae CENA114]QDL19216.1 hypothetical protein DP113_34470 [Brasilonema octagenarum UFV-E1]